MLLGLPKFDYLSCQTLDEACSLLAKFPGEARVLAGGTDLLVKMKHRKVMPHYLINIKKIPDINYIHYDDQEGVRIGALTTIQRIKTSPLIAKKWPVLSQAAGVLGTAHVRNLATLGGNLCNASPASECASPLLTLGASAKIVGVKGERTVPMEAFFVGPGKSVLENDEVLAEIKIPHLPPHTVGAHLKFGTRRGDVAIAGVSVLITLDGKTCRDIRIALGAVGPTPFRAKSAEDILRGQALKGGSNGLLARAAQAASDESHPIDDLRGSAAYRKELVQTLVKQGLECALAQARP